MNALQFLLECALDAVDESYHLLIDGWTEELKQRNVDGYSCNGQREQLSIVSIDPLDAMVKAQPMDCLYHHLNGSSVTARTPKITIPMVMNALDKVISSTTDNNPLPYKEDQNLMTDDDVMTPWQILLDFMLALFDCPMVRTKGTDKQAMKEWKNLTVKLKDSIRMQSELMYSLLLEAIDRRFSMNRAMVSNRNCKDQSYSFGSSMGIFWNELTCVLLEGLMTKRTVGQDDVLVNRLLHSLAWSFEQWNQLGKRMIAVIDMRNSSNAEVDSCLHSFLPNHHAMIQCSTLAKALEVTLRGDRVDTTTQIDNPTNEYLMVNIEDYRMAMERTVFMLLGKTNQSWPESFIRLIQQGMECQTFNGHVKSLNDSCIKESSHPNGLVFGTTAFGAKIRQRLLAKDN